MTRAAVALAAVPGAQAAALAGALAIAACSRRAPIASCDANLRGVYAAPTGRWMLLDDGEALDAYPLFPDADGPADLEIAPRRIVLTRPPADRAATPEQLPPGAAPARAATGTTLAGTLRRRYMHRAEICDAEVPVHVTRCAGDTLELVLADPAPPIGFSPCRWPGPGPSRIERWQRE
jgi:hypothetical protein